MKNVSSINGLENHVPKLRFPEFQGEWREISFNALFETLPNNTLSRAELSKNGTIKNIHYGDILVKFENTLDVFNTEIPYINEESQIKRSDFFLKNGDLIIADTAEDETVGKATELFNAENCNIVSGLHTIPCRPRIKFASKYLGYYVNSYYYHKQLLSLMQGIKVLSISKSNISKTFIKYPCKKEQKKIAAFLTLLDKRITKQRELVDYLKSYKRGVLSKLFPQKGESVPKCRFTGFAEPWEQRKLGAMMNVTSVKRIHQSDWTNSGIRFLRARDIVAASKGEEPTDYLYISQEKFDEYSALVQYKSRQTMLKGIANLLLFYYNKKGKVRRNSDWIHTSAR